MGISNANIQVDFNNTNISSYLKKELEEKILNVCSSILDGKTINAHYSFYQNGGDSLQLIHLISRLMDIFEVNFIFGVY